MVALVLGLGASSHGRPSLEDIHSRERHGFSVRELAEKMSSERSTGYGELTEDDAAVLFLRYQHEFNRTIASLPRLPPPLPRWTTRHPRISVPHCVWHVSRAL